MSWQIGLKEEDIKILREMMLKYGVETVYEKNDGTEIFNEVSIVLCNEEGLKMYFQVD